MQRCLRASSDVKNQLGSVVGVAVKDRVKDTVLGDRVSSCLRTREGKTFNLAGQDIYYNNHKKVSRA